MIVSVYEKKRLERLNKKQLVIEEIYYNNNNNSNEKYIRATDGKMNDNIIDKSLYEKRYFKNNQCIKVENNFNSLIKYTIQSYNDENEIISCPNCGNKTKTKELINGCQYCGTSLNIGINNKNIMKKQILSPPVVGKMGYLILLIIIIMIIIINFKIMPTKLDAIIMTVSLCVMLPVPYLIFCVIIKAIISPSHANYNDTRKEIWKIDKNENVFYSNLYSELMLHFYNDEKNKKEKDLVDFEILEYTQIEFINNERIKINIKLRKTYLLGEEITTKEEISKIVMKYNKNKEEIDNNYQSIKCISCGSPLEVTDNECTYCGKINNIKNEWIIEEII